MRGQHPLVVLMKTLLEEIIGGLIELEPAERVRLINLMLTNYCGLCGELLIDCQCDRILSPEDLEDK